MEVIVTEGRVAVDAKPATVPTDANPAVPPLVYVDAGHNVIVGLATASAGMPPPQVTAIDPAQINARLSWRVPRLEFSGATLAEALALMNGYNRVQSVLADPALSQLRVSGILRADNIENLGLLLEEQYGIHAERRSDGEVVLSRGM